MRGDDDVFPCPKRAAFRKRLRLEYVKNRAADVVDPFFQRVLIHDPSAGNVDQNRVPIHQIKPSCVHNPARLFGQRQRKDRDVRIRQHPVELTDRADRIKSFVFPRLCRKPDHAAAEGSEPLGARRADASAAEDQHITLSCIAVKKRFYLNSVQVYSGEVAQFKAASETGDANSRIITGITDQYYEVKGLTAGATYTYYVEANYIDGAKAASNVETVTLTDAPEHNYQLGDVDHDGSINISDVTALIDMLLGNEGAGCPICADVDGNHDVNISDVTALIDMLLTSN